MKESIDNYSKLSDLALKYAAILYVMKFPDKDENSLEAIAKSEIMLLFNSVVECSFLFYHKALQKSLLEKGVDIGDFPDINSIDFSKALQELRASYQD